jgi:hypothetical protein
MKTSARGSKAANVPDADRLISEYIEKDQNLKTANRIYAYDLCCCPEPAALALPRLMGSLSTRTFAADSFLLSPASVRLFLQTSNLIYVTCRFTSRARWEPVESAPRASIPVSVAERALANGWPRELFTEVIGGLPEMNRAPQPSYDERELL